MSVAHAEKLVSAAQEVLERAEATLSGVGLACHATTNEQENAFQKAFAKRDAAKALLAAAEDFLEKHGSFN